MIAQPETRQLPLRRAALQPSAIQQLPMASLMTVRDATTMEQAGLRKELRLSDLVMAQVLCVVGSSWVGIAAKLGRAHVAFWLGAMLLYYMPLAVVVIYLNRMMPLEGGLYQWAKSGFG